MYCRYCGREIGEKRNFCPHCGRNLSVAPPQPGQTRQAPETSYYAVEFAKIRAGQKTRFNWAAFWFGACHQLYHDSTALFCRTFLPVYITAFVWAIAQGLVLYTAPAYAMPLAIWMVEWGNVAVNVWLLTVMIWNAKTYNRKLYEQTKGNPAAVPQKFGKMILLIVVVLVYQWVLLPAIPDTDALQANVHMPGESVEMLLHTQLPENAWLSERVYFYTFSPESDFTRQNIDLTLCADWPIAKRALNELPQPYSVEFVLSCYFSGGRWYVLQEQSYDSWESAGTNGHTQSLYQYVGYHNGDEVALTFAVTADRGEPYFYSLVSAEYDTGEGMRQMTPQEQQAFAYGLVLEADAQDAAYTVTKEDLLGSWRLRYESQLFEVTPYELGGTAYQITGIEGNTIDFSTPDGVWYSYGSATLSECGRKIHLSRGNFSGYATWDGIRERTEPPVIVDN